MTGLGHASGGAVRHGDGAMETATAGKARRSEMQRVRMNVECGRIWVNMNVNVENMG